MAVTQKINSKANIKNTTDKDLPFSPQLPVVARYEATSTASQTIINMSFSVDQSNTDAFMLHIDGKLLRPGVSNDYTFTSVAADNTSSQVTLNSAIIANLNIVAYKLGTKRELEFQMDNRFVSLYEAQDQGFQGFIKNTLMNATTTTGTPVAGTFYSSIINRAAITDLSQDLRLNFGNDRKQIQQAFALQNEFGSNGEIVHGVANDDRNQIRLVGTWLSNIDSSGQSISTVTVNDYLEITFFGTDLDILLTPAASMDIRSTTDGGTESANLAIAFSTTLNAQGYSPNTVFNVVRGLTLGVHTVKIRNNAVAGLKISGVQILDNSTSMQVNSGISYLQNKKLTLGTASLYSPSASPVTGTRGGRMLVYQNTDGTIGKTFQATNASQLNLTSADHTNEEVAITYHFREFGANKADDFSTAAGSSGARAFTLEDGITTLLADAAFQSIAVAGLNGDSIAPTATNSFMTFTFVGTGLDVIAGGTPPDTFNVSVNGTSIGTGLSFSNAGAKTFKIVSGLPYGTHTVRIVRANTVSGIPGFQKFIVYQPKKPSLPSGAVELADYNVTATYSPNTVAGADTRGVGVLRRVSRREHVYLGTWVSPALSAGSLSGTIMQSQTNGDYLQYTFFGTGFEFRTSNTGGGTPATWQFTLTDAANPSGTTNFTGFTNSFYGASITSWTPSTGTVVLNSTAQAGNGVAVSGLALGWHTIKLTRTAGTGFISYEALDIITPIHSHKSNLNYDQQNTLPVGSQAISDNRSYTPLKDVSTKKKNVSQADGISTSPTTTSASFVPMPDMSVTHYNTTGRIRVSYDATIFENANSNDWETQVFIDGIASGGIRDSFGATTQPISGFQTRIFNVSPGFHKVDVHWKVLSGSGQVITAYKTSRMLLVEEV